MYNTYYISFCIVFVSYVRRRPYGPTSSPGRIKRAEFSGPPPPPPPSPQPVIIPPTPTLHSCIPSRRPHTRTPGLVRGWQYYTRGQRRFTFLDSQTSTTTWRWTPRGLHASPAKHPSDFYYCSLGIYIIIY